MLLEPCEGVRHGRRDACPERSAVTIFSPGADIRIDDPAEVNADALPNRPTEPTEIVSWVLEKL